MSDEYAPVGGSGPSAEPSYAPTPPAIPTPSSSTAPSTLPDEPSTRSNAGAPALQTNFADFIGDPDDFKASLEFLRDFRREVARAQEQRLAADPERQASSQRGATFRSLVAEGYSPEHADYIARLPELFQSNDTARAVQAQQDMQAELHELGLSFEGKDGAERLQDWENACSDVLNRDARLNALYFNPATRRQAIREVIQREERRFNHVLLGQNAGTLRENARRRAAVPAPGRSARATVQVREEEPTAPYSDAAARRRQHREITGRKLDDILATFGR